MSEFDQMLDAVTEGGVYTVNRNGEDVAVILDIDAYWAMSEAINESTETESEG